MSELSTRFLCEQVRYYDLSRNASGLDEEAALEQATAIFRMGWNARRAGLAMGQRPYFVDDALITDWLTGWERCDQSLRRL